MRKSCHFGNIFGEKLDGRGVLYHLKMCRFRRCAAWQARAIFVDVAIAMLQSVLKTHKHTDTQHTHSTIVSECESE